MGGLVTSKQIVINTLIAFNYLIKFIALTHFFELLTLSLGLSINSVPLWWQVIQRSVMCPPSVVWPSNIAFLWSAWTTSGTLYVLGKD